MKTTLAILLTSSLAFISPAHSENEAPAKLIQAIALPDVEGWMDHMSVDVKGKRLFVPAEQKKTLEVIDLAAGKLLRTITGFTGAPRKSVYLADRNEIWID